MDRKLNAVMKFLLLWKWVLCLAISIILIGCATRFRSQADYLPVGTVDEGQQERSFLLSRIGTLWYGIYLDEFKVGWGKVVREIYQPFGTHQKFFRIQKQHEIELLINGYKHQFESRLDLRFNTTPPFGLEYFELFERINDYSVQKKMVKRGQKFRRIIIEDGKRGELPQNSVAYTLEDELFLENWVSKEHELGDFIHLHYIDTNRLQRGSGVAEIIGVESLIISDRKTKTYKIRHPATQQENYISVYGQDSVPLVHKLNSGFELRNEPMDMALAGIGDVDLYVRLMVPIDKPIGPMRTVQRVKLAVDAKTGASLENATGQKIEKNPSGDGFVVTLERNKTFREAIDADDVSLYLKKHPELRKAGQQFIKSAGKEMEGIEKPLEKVERLLIFADDTIEDSNDVLSPGLEYLLNKRKGDCSEHAALFEALAREFGIPCRQVSGLVYMGDWSQSFGLHAWNEVIINGYWIPVDPINRQSALPPLYIRFPLDADKSDRLMLSVHKMKIKVLEVDHFESK
jgi:hypothetical protein